LRVITFRDLPDFLLGSLGIDDPVLSLDPVLDLFPKLLLYNLVLVQETGESSLDSLDLGLHCSVSPGHLEELLDLVLALFSSHLGFRVELVDLHGSSRIGCRLEVSAEKRYGVRYVRVTFGELIEQPGSALAIESSSGWCWLIPTRSLHPAVRVQHLPLRTAPADHIAAAGRMGCLLEPVERIGFLHSSDSAAVRHTGCSYHLVLRRLLVRHKGWYLEMGGLRHWREGGKTPAEEQKHRYSISLALGHLDRKVSSPVITVLYDQPTTFSAEENKLTTSASLFRAILIRGYYG